MKTLSPALLAHIRSGVTTLCTCLEIIRRDGKSFRFTDHDQPVTYANATYTPYAAFARTSVSTSLDLEVDSMEIHGILNDRYVARDDVAAGLFDYADVRFFAINYEAPGDGIVLLRSGKIGEIQTSEDGTFTAELRGLTQALAFRIGESYSPECRADLGDRRCKLALAPPRWTSSTSYQVGQTVVGIINAATSYFNLGYTNTGFDDDSFVELTRDVTGWTSYGDSHGRWTIRQDNWFGAVGYSSYSVYGTDDGDINLDAYNNPQHTVAEIGMFQDIDLEDQGLSHYSLDTGLCRIYTTLWMITVNAKHGGSRYRIFALDEAGVQIGAVAIYDSGVRKGTQNVWFQVSAKDILIPAGTRKLRVDLWAQKKSSDSVGAGFDSLYVAVNNPDGTLGSYDQYGGVAFQAMNTGTSGTTEPTWSNLLGGTFSDNGITWKCVQAYNKTTTVSGIDQDGAIVIPVGVTDPAGYYDGGLLTWEKGRNAGRTQEIKEWSDGNLALFERPFHLPQAGDRMTIFPGCDKLRATCVSKFHNILNFRGEPDVPGQDKYYATPNAATT